MAKQRKFGGYTISSKIMSVVVVTLLATVALFVLTFYLVSQDLSSQLLKQFDYRLTTDIDTAKKEIDNLDGNVLGISGKDDPLYVEVKKKFKELQEDHTLENLYVLSNKGGKERIIILTGEENDFDQDYAFSDEMKQALSEDKMIKSDIYKDSFGTHKSVFLPIKDSGGELTGILGIDLDASVVPETTKKLTIYITVASAIVLIGGLFFSFIMGRRIAKPARSLMESANRIADGDLTGMVEVESKDEIGQLAASFQKMQGRIKELIAKISNSSSEVSKMSSQLRTVTNESSQSAQQVSEAMTNMSEGINDSVANITDCTTSVAEIDTQIEGVTKEVDEMKSVSSDVQEQSESGQKLVNHVLEHLNMLHDKMTNSKQAAEELQSHSTEIESVISIITDISAQTNLLALNASIEAARVGEEGKGFAVVADEVRKLAEQSADAAKTVSDLVIGTQENSQRVLESVEESSKAVEEGREQMEGTSQNFAVIYDGVSQFSRRTNNLLASIKQVEQAYQTISTSIEQISVVSEEHAASSQEVAAATEQQSAGMQQISSAIEQLSDMSEDLAQMVSTFKIDNK
ncbi:MULTISPECIES: methyl-accepting chemotaxis protein [Bacillus]|jgi:methyl-accepting chemotaxis protein|uniref:methyl-accepting chemotaxis protein n=1 Tax=Bacillus TaxID=1386 RepID=UPI00049FDB8A|nr:MULTISPECIES: methyl-accepting chemotaxis protein [Bacillus]AOC57491.1 chemotaxis protein [Bacillus pumilus]AZV51590.1 methyl-accepting chemotaxis protein [Bacillus pumilus]MBR0588276.1 HAMP domain-containing protein [Bacillus pumilus DW2J2]MBR0616533.1 HAMP domain-containing protein [Bacillus pumilus]MBR0625662.1 HAMP domain-containing protein [Bacillus pumilus]